MELKNCCASSPPFTNSPTPLILRWSLQRALQIPGNADNLPGGPVVISGPVAIFRDCVFFRIFPGTFSYKRLSIFWILHRYYCPRQNCLSWFDLPCSKTHSPYLANCTTSIPCQSVKWIEFLSRNGYLINRHPRSALWKWLSAVSYRAFFWILLLSSIETGLSLYPFMRSISITPLLPGRCCATPRQK